MPKFFACVFGVLSLSSLVAAHGDEGPLLSRQVVPVLSRLGCNSGGGCHGAVKGQNGFRLSLFGAKPLEDWERLTREAMGRRIDLVFPEKSLILLKATGQGFHGGGKRTDLGSADYEVLRGWIAAGAKADDVAKSQVKSLRVSPTELTLKVAEVRALKVTAEYADGSSADVTSLCSYESPREEVIGVDRQGNVSAKKIGDAFVVVRYGAEPVLAQVLVVPTERSAHREKVAPQNFIDDHVLAKLDAFDIAPAPLCDDETFLRRLHLDVMGLPPPADEVRAFLKDASPTKRTAKIDEVLAKPGYAEVWAAKFSDLIKPVERGNDGGNNLVPGQVLRIRVYEWLRARLQENVSYDQLVERMWLSSSLESRPIEQWIAEVDALRDEIAAKKRGALGEPLLSVYNRRTTLDLFWERNDATGLPGALQFAHAFLGLRLQCAQCHRHPHDVWQQDDVLSFAHFFTAMTSSAGPRRNSPEVEAYLNERKADIAAWTEEVKKITPSKEPADKEKVAELQAKLATLGLLRTEVTTLPTGAPAVSVKNALGTQESRVARLLGERTNATLEPGQDRRKLVMDWLRRSDNPYFAKAIVNRVWAHYLGRGLIEPPDNLSPLNPPSHPKLLDALCQGFVEHGYDLRWLHRTILQSRTYQQCSHHVPRDEPVSKKVRLPPAHHAQRDGYYATFEMRRLPGEIILDTVNHATGAKEKFPATWMFREGERAILAAGVMVDVYNFYTIKDPLRYLVFGRQVRRTNVQCDCEQGRDVALPQMLFLANHEEVQKKISDPKGRVALLAADMQLDDAKRIEELFLNTLGRHPTATELSASLEHLKSSEMVRVGLEDVLWSLLNTREFQLNY